jgi:hypothetical protein
MKRSNKDDVLDAFQYFMANSSGLVSKKGASKTGMAPLTAAGASGPTTATGLYAQSVDLETLRRKVEALLTWDYVVLIGNNLPFEGFEVIYYNPLGGKDIKVLPRSQAEWVLSNSSSDEEATKRLMEYFWGFSSTSDTSHLQAPRGTANSDNCYHTWSTYHGFSTSYEYCTKCDTKRELENK